MSAGPSSLRSSSLASHPLLRLPSSPWADRPAGDCTCPIDERQRGPPISERAQWPCCSRRLNSRMPCAQTHELGEGGLGRRALAQGAACPADRLANAISDLDATECTTHREVRLVVHTPLQYLLYEIRTQTTMALNCSGYRMFGSIDMRRSVCIPRLLWAYVQQGAFSPSRWDAQYSRLCAPGW